MSSKRETLLAAVATALSGTTGVSTRIYRSRVEALARAETAALIVEPVNDAAEREAVGRLVWQITFKVEVIYRGSVPDSGSDATIVDVHSKIMGSSTLQAMCVDLLPVSVDWQLLPADQPLAVTTMQFMAMYQTAETSIS